MASLVLTAVLQRRCCAERAGHSAAGCFQLSGVLSSQTYRRVLQGHWRPVQQPALGEAAMLGSTREAFEHKLAKLCMLSSQGSCGGTSWIERSAPAMVRAARAPQSRGRTCPAGTGRCWGYRVCVGCRSALQDRHQAAGTIGLKHWEVAAQRCTVHLSRAEGADRSIRRIPASLGTRKSAPALHQQARRPVSTHSAVRDRPCCCSRCTRMNHDNISEK